MFLAYFRGNNQNIITRTTSIKCDHITLLYHQCPEMDVEENKGPSTLKGAAKVFAKRRLESLWQIEGVPCFITMTHRDEFSLCEQYAEHAVAASEKPMVEIPSHRIELAFRTAWPRVVECIEDDAVDEANGKLSWYHDRYQDMVKNAKSLQEQLDSKKERHR